MRYIPKKQNKAGSDQGIKFKRGSTPEFRFYVIKDSREQLPWEFSDFKIHQMSLQAGDYSIGYQFERRLRTLDRIFVVERKGSTSEMVSMVGQDRDRFQRELARLRFVQHPFIICEFTLEEFLETAMNSGLNPTSAFGSICAWQKYMPVIFAGNKVLAKECFLVLARLFFKKYVLCHKRGKLGRGIVEEEVENE